MSTRKTKEEKEILIADYKASGLSMEKWCSAHDIAIEYKAFKITVPAQNILS